MDVPSRKNDQPWIYFNLSPPTYSPIEFIEPHTFNWTVTYRSDSDIPYPYGKIVLREPTELKGSEEAQGEFNIRQKKNKLVAWTVSHCVTEGRREEFVHKLQSFINVDVYGECGDFSCLHSSREDDIGCFKELEKSYKFYLSLENSLCHDYVTEKFYLALNSNLVPVVYGCVKYSTLAPPHSFIDVRQFESIEKLAQYLLFLDKNPEKYEKYFEWKQKYKVVTKTIREDVWCSVCEKIVRSKLQTWKDRKSYPDINLWFNSKQLVPQPEEACVAPTFSKKKLSLRRV